MINRISPVIITKNEQNNIAECLKSLDGFSDIWVVDSGSTDRTCNIAGTYGVRISNFDWNGQYPKKRQWCLDYLELRDWVLFIDADERMNPALKHEIMALNPVKAGYFIKGRYSMNGRILRHGMVNNKLCLINRHMMHFPVIDDLDIGGMGEIEGHYQPVKKAETVHEPIGALRHSIIHYACHDHHQWYARHERYAHWQAVMNARGAPDDRRMIKRVWMRLPFKPALAFVHSFILKRGFLDGKAGFNHALMRAHYYAMISRASKHAATSA